jgi:hypothetical protein
LQTVWKPDFSAAVSSAARAKLAQNARRQRSERKRAFSRRSASVIIAPFARVLVVNPNVFLLLNLALGFYNVGTIWAHEIDIFRSWKLLDPKDFHEVQRVHWRKLPYWIFAPIGLSLLGSIALIWYHPSNSPLWSIAGVFVCQVLSIVLTAMYWGRWQTQLAQDPLGPKGPHLAKILKTHWVRTLLINAYAVILLVWAIKVLS